LDNIQYCITTASDSGTISYPFPQQGYGTSSTTATWNFPQQGYGTVGSPENAKEVKVREDFVVVDGEGFILFQSDEEKKALKWMRKNTTAESTFYLYKAIKRIGPKLEVVEEDL
jgi:hypothetical protein